MPSARDIRRRIKSVKNIQQITKAMKMVAAARLRRAQERANASKPYTQQIKRLLEHAVSHIDQPNHPLLQAREVNQIGYLILSADKGLAGAYTSNLIKEARAQIEGKENVRLVTVGRKIRDYLRRRGYKIDQEHIGFSEKPTFGHATQLARAMAQQFEAGEYDEIHLVYTQFFSPLNHKPVTIKLLPVDADPVAQEMENQPDETPEYRDYIFEPSAAEVLHLLVPRYLETVIYGALMQSAASELGARMTAMGSATDNAQELISKLTLNYNKVRQASITREISEIVGGAEALK